MSKKLLLLFVIVMLAVSLNESAPRVKDSKPNRLWRLLKARAWYENDPCGTNSCWDEFDCCPGWECRGNQCSP